MLESSRLLRGRRRLERDLIGVVEESVELIEIALRERIVLVCVAFRAAHGQSQKGGRHRVHAIDDALDTELLRIVAPLGIEERVAMKAGGRLLRRGCVDRKSTRLNSSHLGISYAVFCLKKKNKTVHT